MPVRQSSLIAALTILLGIPALILLPQTSARAQSEAGKVDKYHELTDTSQVPKDAFPALTIEDLRKITRYDGLTLKRGALIVQDKKSMRKIEPHPTDKGVWVVTSDHYRFSTLKDGVIRKGSKLHKETPFLWIKYESRESPDGTPWLKDLILIPYSAKTGKMQPGSAEGLWPFARNYEMPTNFLNARGMTRRRAAKTPFAHESVVGTLQVKKASYLVLSVFGEYSWPGRVVSLEFVGLRGKSKTAIDAFHAGPSKRGARSWVGGERRVQNVTWSVHFIAQTEKAVAELQQRVDSVFTMTRTDRAGKGWDDLLRQEFHDEPSGLVDSIVAGFKTLGQGIQWAQDHSRGNYKKSFPREWQGGIEDAYEQNKHGYIVAARMYRYAFRKLGYPCRIVAFDKKDVNHPELGIRIYVPERDLCWTILPGEKIHAVSDLSHASLDIYPHIPLTKNGRLPVFDIDLGGEKLNQWSAP